MKIDNLTARNHIVLVLQVAISTIVEFMFFLHYFEFLILEEVNNAIISSNIHATPSLLNMHHQTLMTFS